MSFHPLMLTPDQVRLVQGVFNNLLAEPWFERTPENEHACAKLVIHVYQRGFASEFALKAQCRELARERFAKTPDDVSDVLACGADIPVSWPMIAKATKRSLPH